MKSTAHGNDLHERFFLDVSHESSTVPHIAKVCLSALIALLKDDSTHQKLEEPVSASKHALDEGYNRFI